MMEELEPEQIVSWMTLGWVMVGFVFGVIFTFVALVKCTKD